MQTSLTYNLPAVSLNEPVLIMSACCDISLCTPTTTRHVVVTLTSWYTLGQLFQILYVDT